MERNLLAEVELLRTHAWLGETITAGWVNNQPMVAVNNFVMPLRCFVTLWFWIMLDSKVYARHVITKYDPQLLELNPRLGSDLESKRVNNHLMFFLYNEIKYKFAPAKAANASAKHQMLVQVFEDLGLAPTQAQAA